MNEKEAKFLIDQFNKYASWSIGQPAQILLSCGAITLSSLVIIVSTLHPALNPWISDLQSPSRYIYFMSEFIVIYGFTAGVIIFVSWAIILHGRNEDKLTLLVDYWFRHKSLPDELTFEEITSGKFKKPKDLRKRLVDIRNREPSATDATARAS